MKENLCPFPDYYQMTAILDHCREVQVLADQHRILKATREQSKEDIDFLRGKLDGEMADLAIYLESYFIGKQNVLEARRQKFREKRKQDEPIKKHGFI